METKTKKIILVILIIILIVAAVAFAVMMVRKANQSMSVSMPPESDVISSKNNSSDSSVETLSQEAKKSMPEEGVVTQLSEEEKTKIANIKNVTAKITSISISSIKATTSDGKELNLIVPQSGASFAEQTTQKDGSFMNKEIGLLQVPKNKNVEIQYDSATNEVLLIIIK